MNDFLITVRIADREYRINIDKKKEVVVREAARQINENINTYAESFDYKDKQDLLAMVTLQHTVKELELAEKVAFQEEQLFGKLAEIDRVLSDKLSR
jgi:cell division protein ZapA (FtsZ GTPase activity inhibitor)